MTRASSIRLVVGVGDIHGRFHRVADWLRRLEEARRRRIDAAFAVGDVEAFQEPDHHRRKAVKKQMPSEFSAYARGETRFPCPLYFIGGNNEDFASLAGIPEGGTLAPNVHYLGRSGRRRIAGLEVAFLSGIYAPRWFDQPAQPPRNTVESWKQSGYFRRTDLAPLTQDPRPDLLLLHEWPRGLAERGFFGNPVARDLLGALRPQWLWLGHSHRRLGAVRAHSDATETRIACLDQASQPDGAILWLEWEGDEVARGGWGISGVPEPDPFPRALAPSPDSARNQAPRVQRDGPGR